jgi:Protein of unknown function (DUF2567)
VSLAPSGPEFEPEPFEQAPTGSRWRLAAEPLACLAVAVAAGGLGAPLGLLWRALAPEVELVQTESGPYPVQPEPEGYVADDGWFVLLSIATGALLAVLAWAALRRFRGPLMLLALAVGSVGGAVLAAWLGNRIGLTEYERLVSQAPIGTHMFRPARLRLSDVGLYFGVIPRVRGVVLVQAFVATGVYTAFAGFSHSPALRLDAPEQVPVSWDWPAPRDPAVSPAPPAPSAAAPPLDVAWHARREDG